MSHKFVWYELMTTDMQAAESFYTYVVGWNAKDAGMTNMRYTLFNVGELPVAGLMGIPAEAGEQGARPGWIGYVGVDDVDAYANRVKEAGGVVYHGPADIPEVGRFAVVADPQGTVFALFKGLMQRPQTPPGTPGHAGWHELHAMDGQKAFEFYSDLFGWDKRDTMDMGALGSYQIFGDGEMMMGGVMTKMPAEPRSHWLYYFNVPAIESAVERVKERGGQVINGPTEVPGGSWIINALDPQGAIFALVGPRR
ncbi:MAG TPA: VOC family protein [Methylovirgula sp.]|nr:VOC family protein [Methylovirgula sp.]